VHDASQDETTMVPVPYPVHWAYRGKELKDLTCFEYHALVDVKLLRTPNMDKGTKEGPKKRGRRERRSFRFHPSHPLYNSHAQYIKAKQPTLIFSGKPPRHPGDPPPKA